MGAWHFVLFLKKSLHAHKICRFRGYFGGQSRNPNCFLWTRQSFRIYAVPRLEHSIQSMLSREAVCIARGWVGTPSFYLRSWLDGVGDPIAPDDWGPRLEPVDCSEERFFWIFKFCKDLAAVCNDGTRKFPMDKKKQRQISHVICENPSAFFQISHLPCRYLSALLLIVFWFWSSENMHHQLNICMFCWGASRWPGHQRFPKALRLRNQLDACLDTNGRSTETWNYFPCLDAQGHQKHCSTNWRSIAILSWEVMVVEVSDNTFLTCENTEDIDKCIWGVRHPHKWPQLNELIALADAYPWARSDYICNSKQLQVQV